MDTDIYSKSHPAANAGLDIKHVIRSTCTFSIGLAVFH